MCSLSYTLKDKASKQVDIFITERRMFTAWEVAKAADIQDSKEVGTYVREMFNTTNTFIRSYYGSCRTEDGPALFFPLHAEEITRITDILAKSGKGAPPPAPKTEKREEPKKPEPKKEASKGEGPLIHVQAVKSKDAAAAVLREMCNVSRDKARVMLSVIPGDIDVHCTTEATARGVLTALQRVGVTATLAGSKGPAEKPEPKVEPKKEASLQRDERGNLKVVTLLSVNKKEKTVVILQEQLGISRTLARKFCDAVPCDLTEPCTEEVASRIMSAIFGGSGSGASIRRAR